MNTIIEVNRRRITSPDHNSSLYVRYMSVGFLPGHDRGEIVAQRDNSTKVKLYDHFEARNRDIPELQLIKDDYVRLLLSGDLNFDVLAYIKGPELGVLFSGTHHHEGFATIGKSDIKEPAEISSLDYSEVRTGPLIAIIGGIGRIIPACCWKES